MPNTETETENSAALACITALVEWFEPGVGPEEAMKYIDGEDPSSVAGFLFGQLASAIEVVAQALEITPQRYVQGIALTVNQEIYGVGVS